MIVCTDTTEYHTDLLAGDMTALDIDNDLAIVTYHNEPLAAAIGIHPDMDININVDTGVITMTACVLDETRDRAYEDGYYIDECILLYVYQLTLDEYATLYDYAAEAIAMLTA